MKTAFLTAQCPIINHSFDRENTILIIIQFCYSVLISLVYVGPSPSSHSVNAELTQFV